MSLEFIIQFITEHTYSSLFFLSLIEGANIPVPSEPTLLYSGFLQATTGLHFWLLALIAATGSTIGANISYAIGRWGGRPLLYKYRKFFLLTKKELDHSDRWFDQHRIPVLLISRMLPLVRTIVSFPAGIYETPLIIFNVLTFVGCFVWSILFIALGGALGERWEILLPYIERFTLIAIVLVLAAIVWYIWHKIHKIRHEHHE